MIYLDYSATTPVDDSILDTYVRINKEFIGNANSLHKLGINASKLIENATMQIKDILKLNDKEIIYTSGSTESNNLAIKGIALKYKNRGKHIITSKFEHSSVYEPLEYLKKLGFEISYVENDASGRIDINNLKKLIRDDTILVSINAVNSEIGIIEPFEEIGNILKDYPKCFYHVDLTQAIGKIRVNFENIDLASFSAHKIYGLKGIGCLVKSDNIELEPLLNGGKSTTIYRSGTPAHPLIASLSKSVRLASDNLDEKYNHVKELNNYIKEKLKNFENVYINSNDYCIPHILNISIKGIKSETFLHALEEYEIYVSTKSACGEEGSLSESVLAFTGDKSLAESSIRISLSHLTTKEEIDTFISKFNEIYNRFKQ